MSTRVAEAGGQLMHPEPPAAGLVVVGRLGRAHGVRGDLAVEVRTDAPELRFATGSVLLTSPAGRGPITVTEARSHSGRLLLHLRGIDDRTAAEALTGTLLLTPPATGDAGPGAWWDHELVGLRAEIGTGELVGVVTDVLHPGAQDLLALVRPDGTEMLLPFVGPIVPVVDVAGGRLVVVPPAGLLEL